jgi:hypothetical protein
MANVTSALVMRGAIPLRCDKWRPGDVEPSWPLRRVVDCHVAIFNVARRAALRTDRGPTAGVDKAKTMPVTQMVQTVGRGRPVSSISHYKIKSLAM